MATTTTTTKNAATNKSATPESAAVLIEAVAALRAELEAIKASTTTPVVNITQPEKPRPTITVVQGTEPAKPGELSKPVTSQLDPTTGKMIRL